MITLAGCGPANNIPTQVPTAVSSVLDTPRPTPPPATATPLPSTTPSPTATIPPPTATATTTSTPTETTTPTAPPPGQPTITVTSTNDLKTPPNAVAINGIPLNEIVIMNDDVRKHIQAIFRRGQALGRNARAFSKLGDSAILTGHFLTRFDYPPHYNLGEYRYLQPIIDYYAGSFGRYGVSSQVGLSSWWVLDPEWTNGDWCLPEEHMLACEIRLNNPSLLIIRIGTNDATSVELFEKKLNGIVEYTIHAGVIPILATKTDRFEGEDNRNNEAIRRVAATYRIPLWDFDRLADSLPEHGMRTDQVHMSVSLANDYTDPETFTKGYPMNDLTALFMLQAVLSEVNAAFEPLPSSVLPEATQP